ncbi:hypothetical protein ACS0TY_004374 [Phlomoides rotata]
MRINFLFDVSKPLKRWKRIKKVDSSVFVASFKYEKLNQFCFVCGRLGHTENFCEVVFNAPDGEEIKHEWGGRGLRLTIDVLEDVCRAKIKDQRNVVLRFV